MILEFKTARNKTSGSRKYLFIDTGAECYTTENRVIFTDGIEIKTADYKELIKKLNRMEYRRF